eukprot:2939377-Pleurochrysis_carterae.AAC.2
MHAPTVRANSSRRVSAPSGENGVGYIPRIQLTSIHSEHGTSPACERHALLAHNYASSDMTQIAHLHITQAAAYSSGLEDKRCVRLNQFVERNAAQTNARCQKCRR